MNTMQNVYSVQPDVLLSNPETEAANLVNFTRCAQVLGSLVPPRGAADDTVKYREYVTAAEGAPFHGVQSLREMVKQLPPECDLYLDRGAVRVRVYKAGVRVYALWQKTTAALFLTLTLASLIAFRLT